MSVIAASSNSDNQAARERDQIIEDSIAIAGTKHVFSSAQDFIRESCQQVTREEFDSDSITLPVAKYRKHKRYFCKRPPKTLY